MKKFYITTAIDYTSGKPHIGNNYEKVYADVVARFKDLKAMMYYFKPELMNMVKRSKKSSNSWERPSRFCKRNI